MKVENVEQVLMTQLMSKIFQKGVGESQGFSVMLDSLMSAFDESGSDPSEILKGLDLGNEYKNGGANILNKASVITKEVGKEITSIKRNLKPENIPGAIESAIKMAAKKYGVEEGFIKAVIKQESSFNPYEKSSAGAMGLMQLMPGTASGLGVTDPYSIEQNVDGGTKYLKGLLESYGNCKEMALSAYNAGPNAVKRRNMKSPDEIYKMPNETRNYVKKVMNYYKTEA